jgi:hypothetical protein
VTDDGLDDEHRHVFAPELLLERVQVVERNGREPWKKRLEGRREVGAPVRRQRSESEPVEAAVDRDDSLPPGRGPADLQRRLDRLRARVRKEDAPEARRRDAQEFLGEEARELRHAERDASR